MKPFTYQRARTPAEAAAAVAGRPGATDLAALKSRLVARGVWVRPFGDILYLTPALTIADDDLDRLIAAVAAETRAVI